MFSEGFRVIKADRAIPRGVTRPGPRREAVGTVPLPGMRSDGPAPAADEALLAEARRRAAALEERAAGLLAEAEEAARARREQAEAEAAAIVAAAERSAAAIREQAREEGRAEGRRQGREEGMAAARQEAEAILAAARAEAERITAEARARWQQRLAELEPDLVRLALAIARRVLREEIRLRPEAIAGMVAAALEKVRGAGEARLRVNPADAGRLAVGAPAPAGVAVVPDASLAPGEFVVESEHGTVDGRLEAQVAQIAAALGVEVPEA
ncbi:FliH/SctL family protein [Caldinitratiruptor microaerophilus]|uniref:Flagellar assembly protein FliH/Type III secretion system HrpE domain-containing protein n=1 Tax=Caldinitratiruptor microaerophilus TaxID=671077 RepID=A0AA35CL69_9FIRM|nr:FliH/SctL family protein [Caldinitratiruptor microaerophilus]BDG59351.1 hypothetical protein caldi_04410 [Caldinitratiruptor microaerophilus]